MRGPTGHNRDVDAWPLPPNLYTTDEMDGGGLVGTEVEVHVVRNRHVVRLPSVVQDSPRALAHRNRH